MQGVALNLDDMAIPIFSQYATASRAFSACGGVPGGLSGDDIFRWDDEWD
jgi:hypothetical protein